MTEEYSFTAQSQTDHGGECLRLHMPEYVDGAVVTVDHLDPDFLLASVPSHTVIGMEDLANKQVFVMTKRDLH